jgi:1-acyl-sn-glycerol-3-phosphate acyltransferase
MANPIHHLRGLILTIPWLLYLLVVDVALSLLLPFTRIVPNWTYDASSFLAYTVWNWVQLQFELFNGAIVTFSGDELPQQESAIVIANHVSWTDFYMIQALALRANMLGRCRWFAKIQLKKVPFLGWGLWAMGMPLVSRNWVKDKKELDRVFEGIVKRGWPTCSSFPVSTSLVFNRANAEILTGLISYSEATRYTPEKYEETKVWCKENEKPLPKHLLYPRTKGFITTVQHLRKAKQVKAVYDMTIAYSRGNKFLEAPTIWDTLSLPGLSEQQGFKFHVHARRFELNSLPDNDAELAKWLEERWIEKGEWLEGKREEWARG